MTQEDRSTGGSSRLPKTAIVSFSGEFDIASKEDLRRELDGLVGVQRLCLDVSEVRYIDSTAIGELIRLHKQRVERGFDTETLVIGDNQPVRRLLDILHLGSLFSISESTPASFAGSDEGVARRTVAFNDGLLQASDRS